MKSAVRTPLVLIAQCVDVMKNFDPLAANAVREQESPVVFQPVPVMVTVVPAIFMAGVVTVMGGEPLETFGTADPLNVVPACTTPGTTIEETENNSTEVSNSTINRELELRSVNLGHVVLISLVVPI